MTLSVSALSKLTRVEHTLDRMGEICLQWAQNGSVVGDSAFVIDGRTDLMSPYVVYNESCDWPSLRFDYRVSRRNFSRQSEDKNSPLNGHNNETTAKNFVAFASRGTPKDDVDYRVGRCGSSSGVCREQIAELRSMQIRRYLTCREYVVNCSPPLSARDSSSSP